MAKELSFQERLKAFSEEELRKAASLPEGPERDLALRKVRQAETASGLAHSLDAAKAPE